MYDKKLKKSEAKIIRKLEHQARVYDRHARTHDRMLELNDHDLSRQHALDGTKISPLAVVGAVGGTLGGAAAGIGISHAVLSSAPINPVAPLLAIGGGAAAKKVAELYGRSKITDKKLQSASELRELHKLHSDHYKNKAAELRKHVDQLHKTYKSKYGEQVEFSSIITDRDLALSKYRKHQRLLNEQLDRDQMSKSERRVHLKNAAVDSLIPGSGAIMGTAIAHAINPAVAAVSIPAAALLAVRSGRTIYKAGRSKNSIGSRFNRWYHQKRLDKLNRKWGLIKISNL